MWGVGGGGTNTPLSAKNASAQKSVILLPNLSSEWLVSPTQGGGGWGRRVTD